MSKPNITVRKAEDGKSFELLLNDRVIGTSKLQCDAELYANLLNEAIDAFGRERYDDGYDEGHRIGVDEFRYNLHPEYFDLPLELPNKTAAKSSTSVLKASVCQRCGCKLDGKVKSMRPGCTCKCHRGEIR